MKADAIGALARLQVPDLATKPAGASDGARFHDLLANLVRDADVAQKNSDALVHGLAKGEPVDAHQVVMALTEADLSFRTLLEVRNKLIEAYQEVQRMQV